MPPILDRTFNRNVRKGFKQSTKEILQAKIEIAEFFSILSFLRNNKMYIINT